MKKNVEFHHLKSLLKRISNLGYEMPSKITPSERPDFILTIAQQRIGVETTSSVYQEYVRSSKLHYEQCSNSCVNTTHLLDRDKRRSNDDLLGDMLNLYSPWKDAEKDMRDWRDKIASALEVKRSKLSNPEFQLFDKNWLLIHDEPGLANDIFTHDRACRHVASLFATSFSSTPDFDTIFILSKRYLFRWHEQQLTLSYSIDLPNRRIQSESP
jgi:hypothetical protein